MRTASRFQVYEAEQLQDEEVEAMQQELDEHCLRLCIILLDHQLDHDEYESAVVSFLAVMGLEQIWGGDAG